MSLLKLLHVLFIFVWIGGLLTLTRLMGYHSKQTPEVQLALGKIYRRMYLFVDLPSMCLAVILGILLFILKKVDFHAGWCHMKLTFAFLLIISDLIAGRQAIKLSKQTIGGKGVGYKILHGLTALFLIATLFSIYILKAC